MDLISHLTANYTTFYIHPRVIIGKDRYGGTGLFIRRRKDEKDAVEDGQLLLAVPRDAMIEAPAARGLSKGLEESLEGARATNADLASAILLRKETPELLQLPTLDDFEHFHPLSWDPLSFETERKVRSLVDSVNGIPDSGKDTFRMDLLNGMKTFRGSIQEDYEANFLPVWRQLASDPKAEPPDFHDYLWARLIASTRAMHLWDGATLVPLADFMNYSRIASVTVGCEDDLNHNDDVDPGDKDDERGSGEKDSDTETSDSSSDFSTDEAYFAHLSSISNPPPDSPLSTKPPKPQPTPENQRLAIRAARPLIEGDELTFNYFSFPLPKLEEGWEKRKDGVLKWMLGYGFVPD